MRAGAREFGVQEGDIEGGVVNDQFRLADELEELRMNVAKRRLLREPFARQAVHLLRALVDIALRDSGSDGRCGR